MCGAAEISRAKPATLLVSRPKRFSLALTPLWNRKHSWKHYPLDSLVSDHAGESYKWNGRAMSGGGGRAAMVGPR